MTRIHLSRNIAKRNIAKKSQNKSKNVLKKILRFFKNIFLSLCVIFALSAIIIVITWILYGSKVRSAKENAYEKLSTLTAKDFDISMDTNFYYADGSIMASLINGNYKYVSIDNVSDYIISGYVAVEDKRFYSHSGIDISGIARAAVAYVKNHGTITQGGSTITQQVVKNNLLTKEKTIDRKLTEIFTSFEVEKVYTKQQIMEMYVNTNFYGNNCYGIEAACNYYFGCSADDVTVSQAAALIGISNAPTRYNPVNNYDNCIAKRNIILVTMLNEGVITQLQYDEAIEDSLELVLHKETSITTTSYEYTYALFAATEELMLHEGFTFKYIFDTEEDEKSYDAKYSEKYAECNQDILNGGYEIYTSIERDKQTALQESVDECTAKYTERTDDGRFAFQAASVCIDNSTNYIVAIVGGRENNESYNRAYQGVRQPGSSIKPLVDYGPAFDTGAYYPSLKISDSSLSGTYNPANWYKGYYGDISIRYAILQSTNTIPVKILEDIGTKNCLNYLAKMRFSHIAYSDNNNAAIAIGGFTYGTTPAEMAKAYNTIINNGIYSDRTCIISMTASDGDVIRATTKEELTNVYSDATAFMLTDCMADNFVDGFSKKYNITNQISAGKTGTTNSNKDAWFCGYTAYYTCSVWCGYDIPREMSVGAEFANYIWHDFMKKIHVGLEEQSFKKPISITEQYIDYWGKPVNYNSGTTDYFISEKLVNSDKSTEYIQLAAEIKSLESIELKDIDTIMDFMYSMNNLKKRIYTVSDDYERAELLKSFSDMYNLIWQDNYNSLKGYDITVPEIEEPTTIAPTEPVTQPVTQKLTEMEIETSSVIIQNASTATVQTTIPESFPSETTHETKPLTERTTP